MTNTAFGLPKLTYKGWSSFGLDTESGHLYFDPFYRKVFKQTYATLKDFADAKLILVSHGHGDHCIDVPAIAKLTGAAIIAPREICDHFEKKSHIPRAQMTAVESYKEILTPAFKITPFAWGHKEGKLFSIVKAMISHGAIMPALRLGWVNLREAPFDAPAFGYHVETKEGLRILNYSEAFTDATKLENVEEVAGHFETDVLIAGAQLDWQEYLAQAVAILRPKVVILYPPHENTERALGFPGLPPSAYVDAVRKALPQADVQWVVPGSTTVLKVGG